VVGVSDEYLSSLIGAGNPVVTGILDETDRALADKTITLSATIQLLARKAALRMQALIQSNNEHIALKASSDILDRTPETSKTFRGTVTSWNLDSADAKDLAAALVEAAKVKASFAGVAAGDFVRVELEADPDGNAQAKEGHKALRQVHEGNGDSGDRPSIEREAQRVDGEPEGGLQAGPAPLE